MITRTTIFAIVTVFFTGLVHGLHAQSVNKQWKENLNQLLKEYKNCSGDEKCMAAVAKSVEVVYNVKDFFNADNAQYLSVRDISEKLAQSSSWKLVGPAYKQELLEKSQEMANQGKPVLAVYKNKAGETVHMALIVPGELVYSGSWAMKVPEVASFFTHQPEKSFVDHGLSYAFTKNMLLNLELYARN